MGSAQDFLMSSSSDCCSYSLAAVVTAEGYCTLSYFKTGILAFSLLFAWTISPVEGQVSDTVLSVWL